MSVVTRAIRNGVIGAGLGGGLAYAGVLPTAATAAFSSVAGGIAGSVTAALPALAPLAPILPAAIVVGGGLLAATLLFGTIGSMMGSSEPGQDYDHS